jgi:uridine phosphorylase
VIRDLKKDDWLEILNLDASHIPEALLLRGTRNLKRHYDAHLPHFDVVAQIGTPNGVLEDVFVGKYNGVTIGYASVYGAAMASEVVHLFGVLGTRLVIQTGCCGALADGFAAGDLFLATEAFCGEGAAQYYLPGRQTVRSTFDTDRLRSLAGAYDIPIHAGRIYTTGALFAEGIGDIERWFEAGFAAVDMETAATFAVAEHFGMERASILFGFDNPRQKEHMLLSDAEKDAGRDRANAAMIELALAAIRSYCAPLA